MLEQYMTSPKPYLQPCLSLADVSVATNIPPYLLKIESFCPPYLYFN